MRRNYSAILTKPRCSQPKLLSHFSVFDRQFFAARRQATHHVCCSVRCHQRSVTFAHMLGMEPTHKRRAFRKSSTVLSENSELIRKICRVYSSSQARPSVIIF